MCVVFFSFNSVVNSAMHKGEAPIFLCGEEWGGGEVHVPSPSYVLMSTVEQKPYYYFSNDN